MVMFHTWRFVSIMMEDPHLRPYVYGAVSVAGEDEIS